MMGAGAGWKEIGEGGKWVGKMYSSIKKKNACLPLTPLVCAVATPRLGFKLIKELTICTLKILR